MPSPPVDLPADPPADQPAARAVDARLPPGRTLLLGLQHVLAMYAGAVAVPLIFGAALGLSDRQVAYLINADLFTCGLATLLQTLGLGRHLGVRLPVLLGVSFVAVGPMIAIGQNLGLRHVYGAIICSGLLVLLLAPYFSRLRRFFPPVVTGSVVTIIGTSLLPVALNWAAGGKGAADFGAPRHLLLALFVLAVVTVVQRYGRGFLSAIAVLLGLTAGAVVELLLGRMHLGAIGQARWVAVTTPFSFGMPQFDPFAVLTMTLVGLVCMVESTGVFFALGRMVGVPVDEPLLRRGLRAEGLAICLGGCLNSFPYTTFSQNVGLVALTRVQSRFVVAAAGGILVLLGLLPKFAALVAALPPPVLGGAGVALFGMVAAAGIQILSGVDFGQPEHLFIVAVSVGLGLGVSIVPGVFAALPGSVRWLCSDGIVIGTLSAVGLNGFLRPAARASDSGAARPTG